MTCVGEVSRSSSHFSRIVRTPLLHPHLTNHDSQYRHVRAGKQTTNTYTTIKSNREMCPSPHVLEAQNIKFKARKAAALKSASRRSSKPSKNNTLITIMITFSNNVRQVRRVAMVPVTRRRPSLYLLPERELYFHQIDMSRGDKV